MSTCLLLANKMAFYGEREWHKLTITREITLWYLERDMMGRKYNIKAAITFYSGFLQFLENQFSWHLHDFPQDQERKFPLPSARHLTKILNYCSKTQSNLRKREWKMLILKVKMHCYLTSEKITMPLCEQFHDFSRT